MQSHVQLSVVVDVKVEGMVCDFRQHEELIICYVGVQPLTYFHEVVEDVPCPYCRVVDKFVVPWPYEDASSAVFSPVTCVAKVKAKDFIIVSKVCEGLKPEVDHEVHDYFEAHFEEGHANELVQVKLHG